MISHSDSASVASGMRHAIFDLFGNKGCTHYAGRVSTHQNTIRRGLQDRNSAMARTLDLVLSLFLTARDLGANPLELLQSPWTGDRPLIVPMERHLGGDAVALLADRMGRTHRAITHGLTDPQTHLWSHFEVVLTILDFIAQKGGCLLTAVSRRIQTFHQPMLAQPVLIAQFVLPAGQAAAV